MITLKKGNVLKFKTVPSNNDVNDTFIKRFMPLFVPPTKSNSNPFEKDALLSFIHPIVHPTKSNNRHKSVHHHLNFSLNKNRSRAASFVFEQLYSSDKIMDKIIKRSIIEAIEVDNVKKRKNEIS